jgi:uncharacterized protein YhaN
MRLRTLSLARYGKFTDQTIDFGAAVPGAPDLHLVYGPNEAGKSTAFAGFLDLLFGIELHSRYNFLHPYDTMRIGACLELSTGPRELVRIKKPHPTLRDAASQPVPESLILAELGGLDRASYRTMFSLDDDTLEAGGNSILASNGELGQLLFSASAGLAELSKILLDLRARADGFTWPNARSGELHKLKSDLAALKLEREKVDILASDYGRLAADRDAAAAAYEAALREQSQAKSELETVRRMQAALPHAATLRGLMQSLDQFADLPAVPSGWLAELPALESAELRHRSQTELAEAEIKRLTEATETIVVDTKALGLAGGLDRLQALAARNVTAEIDLPVRQQELARADGEVAAILVQLGREGDGKPHLLRLTHVQSAAFDALIGTRSGIEAKLTAAAEEQSQAVLALTEARQALQAAAQTEVPNALPAIVSALRALRDSDHLLRLRTAANSRLQLGEAWAARLASLVPWEGTGADLAALAVPAAEQVQAWKDQAEQQEALLDRRRADLDRLQAEWHERTSILDAIKRIDGLLSDQEAAEIRSAREAAWADHRRTLDPRSAEMFEAALRRDDLAASARLGQERDRAKLHETAQAALIKQAEVRRAETLLSDTIASVDRHAGLVAQAAARIAPALADLPPAQLQAWIARREDAMAVWRQLCHAEADAQAADAEAAALSGALRSALTQAGLRPDPLAAADMLAAAADAAIARDAQIQTLRNDVAERERDVRKRELAVQKASLDDKAWLVSWRQACAACWLGEAASTLPFAAVRGMLAASAALGPALKERSGLEFRIKAMQDDQAAFARELDRLTTELGIDPGGRSGADLAAAVSDRVAASCRAAQERQTLQDALAQATQRQREVQDAARAHASRVAEMMAALQARSLIEIAGKLRDAQEKSDLQQRAAAAERELLAIAQADNLADAQRWLNGRLPADLQIEEARLASHLDGLEPRVRELFAASRAAADRIDAVGGDNAAARIEETRRTKLLEVEEKADRYLRLRLGIAAADRALRAYRDQHRSAMMRQASEAFTLISRGAYRGLTTQPGKDGDILVAVSADGATKLAADLSKGTRFQLYLALRAAGYREFAKVRPPVPFVADDIMETFDDFRAEETLKLLGEMSQLGQIIYFTHHDHLKAIAARTVPGVRIHQLGSRPGMNGSTDAPP